MTLLFYVNNQSLTFSSVNKEVVSDSKNYLKAKFVFQTNDWKNDKPKYALFTHDGKTYKKYLGIEEGVNENECFVAPEVIKANSFSVAVFCEDYITTNKVEVPVIQSGYTEVIENQPSTRSTMEQMNTMLYQYANLCNEILKECQRIEKKLKEDDK